MSTTNSEFKDFIDNNTHFVVIQADNPDGDSLASALALEAILENHGKTVSLYCGVEIPSYLKYMDGWDRIQQDLPQKFDASIIVDTTALSLLESLQKSSQINWVRAKPCYLLDHHTSESTIEFGTALVDSSCVSTGQLIYKTCEELKLVIPLDAAEFIAYSILSDSLGLTSEAVSSATFAVMAQLLEAGVSVAKIDDARRSLSKKSKRIVRYKGELLSRIEYYEDPRIATITIPWAEIEQYSHEYNPSMLVIDEIRMTEGVQVAIAFKTYPDGKITAKIRSNYGYKVASKIAEHFGGGGHPYAAGFKLTNKPNLEETKQECIEVATNVLNEIQETE